MSHDLENKNGNWSFVYSKQDGPGWHDLGTEADSSVSTASWRELAGHNFTVSKRQVFFAGKSGEMLAHPDRFSAVRDDTEHALGIVSDVYKIVQPTEVDDICDNFASFDERLLRSAAFTLRQGDMICSTYSYRDDVLIAGEQHRANLMASTTFDGSGATNFWISVVRAVCQNTITAGLAGTTVKVSVRHNGAIKPDRVREQLAALAQQVKQYQAIGDALAAQTMSKEEISAFFKAALDIPLESKQDDVSTRKMNQFQDLVRAYGVTRRERNGSTDQGDAWSALQAVTRYVDHDRSVKVGDTGNETIARFDSANFGSGALFKAKAMGLLLPVISQKVAA